VLADGLYEREMGWVALVAFMKRYSWKNAIKQQGLALFTLWYTAFHPTNVALAERLFPEMTEGRTLSQCPEKGLDAEWRNQVLLKTNSSELPKFERYTPTAISGVRGFAKTNITNRLFAKTQNYAAGIYQKETEIADGGPPNDSTQFFGGYGSSSAFSLQTENQIEITAGVDLRGETEQKISRDNAGLKSETVTQSFLLWRPHFGFSKKAAAWTAGAFYSMGDEEEVDVTTRVLDDTRTEKTIVALSPKIGGFFEAKLAGTMTLGTELDFILGSSNSLKVGNKEVYDDSYRVQAHVVFQYGGNESLWFSFTYETLSYSDQNFISFDNIPFTDLEATYTFSSGYYLGGIVTYSEDKQSTDEINRTFQIVGFSLRTGFKLPMN
jgi:hypothetical protein